jgi:hypothetical protein
MSDRSRKPSSAGVSASAKRASAQRAEAARARIAEQQQRRRRMRVVLAAIGAVVVVVVALVAVRLAVGGNGPSSGTKASQAAAAVTTAVTSVPPATLDTVGGGTARVAPAKITSPALSTDGKPEVLYVGAEYCPFCAAERWAVVVALSRFGTFTGLGQTSSSPTDVHPNTTTLTFHGASYASTHLAFVGREIESNQVVNGGYAPLDRLTAAQQALVTKYDAPPYTTSTGSIPFVDIGGRYIISGASYDPSVLQGKTHQQIATALADPASPIARAVDGTANLITAALCKITNGQPAAVCTSAGVTTVATKLAS